MAKKAPAFQMNDEDREPAVPSSQGSVAVLEAPAPAIGTDVKGEFLDGSFASQGHADVLKVPHHGAARPAYREGRRNLSVWMEAKGFNTFKAMVAEEGCSMSDYLIDMINREFARKNRPQIARK